jgi:tRNA 5-methylaminomethyl-2-thiouridine biosynthesis bifunctional protein
MRWAGRKVGPFALSGADLYRWPMPRLPDPPDIAWDDHGRLWDRRYGDIYFSREDGLAETRLTFLEGCGLPGAWAGRAGFAICELGFGTGLNFLATLDLWRRTRPAGAILDFHTIEAHLLNHDDAARALAAFPELTDLAARLLSAWPVRCHAGQTIWFADLGVRLVVHQGDAAAVLADLRGRFDAFFLDGFAPARNTAMWSQTVFDALARLAAPDAKAATFSVAATVREGLAAAGFSVARAPGFGRKKHRLIAQRSGDADPITPPRTVAIIGGGIAGAAAADAFMRRGCAVTIHDAGPSLAGGASGNPAGLISLRLDRGPAGPLWLGAYLAAVARYRGLGAEVFVQTGLAQNPRSAAEATAFADLTDDPALPADWLAVQGGGFLLPQAGVLNPVAAIAKLSAGAEIRCGAAVDDPRQLTADAVVIAAGPGLSGFGLSGVVDLQLSRGQIDWVGAPQSQPAVSDGGYVARAFGLGVYGATFAPAAGVAQAVNAADSAANWQVLQRLAPELANAAHLGARASVRAATPDRLPLCGECPDPDEWAKTPAHAWADAPMPRRRRLYLLGGFGARGLTLAPMLADDLAALVCGAPPLLGQTFADQIDPARFLRRALRRRKPDLG